MTRYLLAIGLTFAALPAAAQPDPAPPRPVLNLQQQTALRCSVALALGAERDRAGTADVSWPDLRVRGREFFVRALAQLMDETGATREGLLAFVAPEAAALREPGRLEAAMPACLLLLDASGV